MRRLILIALLTSACAGPVTKPATDASPAVFSAVPSMMKAYEVDGFAITVVSGDEVVFSRGYGVTAGGETYGVDTACSLYSSTKFLSSLVYASLVEDGAIDLEASLGSLIIDAPAVWFNIPFWRLLNHTSGIAMIVNKPIFETMSVDPTAGNADIYRFVRMLPLDYQPGEYSRYRQSGYAVAEMILQDRMGWDWRELVSSHVTQPAGATHTYHTDTHENPTRTPLIVSAGGYQTTASDMGLIFRALNRGAIVSRDELEALLYSPQYNFDGYSLGSILEEVDGVKTIGHRGGGARANVRYAPSIGLGVAACTDDTSNSEMLVDLTNMVIREQLEGVAPLSPIRVALHEHFSASVSKLVAAYAAEKAARPPRYDFSGAENLLNSLGYKYLADDRVDDSITILALNTKEFPDSANTHDSLGDALFAAGKLDDALASYRRALALNPTSENAAAMIKKIESP